jgi:hypothetical protein
MSKTLSISMALVISVVSGLLLLTACKADTKAVIDQPATSQTSTPQAIAPYIPPAYYQCIDVLPMDLENAFYSAYGNHAEAEAMYNGKAFVFKNLLVDAYMIREVAKGWIWADLTKCPVINLDAAKKLKPGERVDIVGFCMGRDLTQSPGLVFKDCYVLQTGSIQLPAPGGGSAFAPAY